MSKKDRTQRILNCDPSPNLEKDWEFEDAMASGGLAKAARLPKSVDLREDWWNIGDQGQTGSCVGWAAADSVLRWHFLQAKKISKSEMISPRFIWMAAKETDPFTSYPTTFIEDSGTYLKAALDIARKFGAVTDSVLPFKSGKLYPNQERQFYAIASRLKIASYYNLRNNIKKWKEWLARNGPILTRLNVDDTFYDAPKGKLRKYNKNKTYGGHAIALVGYDSKGFIVRNSWGTNWGKEGYAHASNSYASNAFSEAYGVIV